MSPLHHLLAVALCVREMENLILVFCSWIFFSVFGFIADQPRCEHSYLVHRWVYDAFDGAEKIHNKLIAVRVSEKWFLRCDWINAPCLWIRSWWSNRTKRHKTEAIWTQHRQHANKQWTLIKLIQIRIRGWFRPLQSKTKPKLMGIRPRLNSE